MFTPPPTSPYLHTTPTITSYYFESHEKDINQGSGSVNALMRDSIMADHLRATIENAERGTAAFAEDMEALRSNSTSFSLLHHCIHDVIKLLSELTLAY